MGLIWHLSDQPGSTVGLPHPWDKGAHALAYGALGFFLAQGLNRPLLGFLLAGAYGLVDELHQAQIPSREVSPWDWLADLLGAALGVRLAGRRGVPKAYPPPGSGPEGGPPPGPWG